jgi:CelD/BcsL family acetyltransferase involved in cellulose biosynthesis
MPLITHIGRESLEPLTERWNDLASRAGRHIFQSPAFCRAWADTVGVALHAKPLVVEHRDDDDATTAIFPACVANIGPMRIITWLGGPHVLDYGDILYDAQRCPMTAEQFVSSAISLLHKHAIGAFLYLTNVRADAVSMPALADSARTLKSSVAPFIDIGDGYDAYVAGLTRKRRHNLERVERKLARAGDVRFELLEPGDERFSASFHELMQIYRVRFSHRDDSAPIFDDAHERFRIRMAESCPGSSLARLTLDGELVASSFQCATPDRFYYLTQAFDARFAEFAPGRVLTAKLLQTACQCGSPVFDFCWGAEAYKYQWTDREVRLDTFISADAAGRALALAVAFRRLAKITIT